MWQCTIKPSVNLQIHWYRLYSIMNCITIKFLIGTHHKVSEKTKACCDHCITAAEFDRDSSENLSNILYRLKLQKKNLQKFNTT